MLLLKRILRHQHSVSKLKTIGALGSLHEGGVPESSKVPKCQRKCEIEPPTVLGNFKLSDFLAYIVTNHTVHDVEKHKLDEI